jgi:hypothetical protein
MHRAFVIWGCHGIDGIQEIVSSTSRFRRPSKKAGYINANLNAQNDDEIFNEELALAA